MTSIRFFSISEQPAPELNPENTAFFQDHPCNFSIVEILSRDTAEINVEIFNNPSGPIECFGKNFWYEYQPAKLLENGWAEFEEAKIRIWINTNINLDLIIQSLIWLILISLIPKSSKTVTLNKKVIIPIIVGLSYLHLIGESEYYSSFSRDFITDLFTTEYDNTISFGNYFIYLYIFSIILISVAFIKLVEERLNNLINYFPFIFLIYGTYASLNLNFFLIIFSIFGIQSLLNKQIPLKISLIYFSFLFFWILNFNSKSVIFDVDKLKGFVNTSQTLPSLIFWSIIVYLLVCGINFLIFESKNSFNYKKFTSSLLSSSSLIFLLGNLAAKSKLFNYITFYSLGLNKFGMRTLESVEGNTWRGLSPSAEGMGEFFGFTLLFSIIIFLEKKIELKLLDYLQIAICLAALLKTNNAAAIISVVLFLVIYILTTKLKLNSKKIIGTGFIFIISLIIYLYLQILGNHSYQYISNVMLFEGVNASIISEDVNKNQFGQTQRDQANYAYILKLPQEDAQLSSSLRFLLESYNSDINIKYLPKLVSILSASSFFINRSEKWGIFFAKYDPDIVEFLFGYGPQQFTEYYLDHTTYYDFGLFLPHSSIFDLMIFYGIFGLFIFMSYIFIKSKDNLYLPVNNIFIFYFVINFFKSDSLLYLPNFVFFVFICNIYKFEFVNDEKAND